MFGAIKEHLAGQLQEIRDAGLFKGERVITTGLHRVAPGQRVRLAP